MADRYVFNPLTGKMDIAGEGGGGGGEEIIDWDNNVTTPTLPINYTSGKTIKDILHDMWCKEQPPTLVLSANPLAGTYETGWSKDVNLTITATKGTQKLTKIDIYINNTLKETFGEIEEDVQTRTETFVSDKISEATSIKVVVYDKGNQSATKQINYLFGWKKFIGYGDAIELDKISTTWLSTLVGGNISVATSRATSSTKCQNNGKTYLYVAMPKTWGCTATNIEENSSGSFMAGAFIHKGDVLITSSLNTEIPIEYSVFVTENKLKSTFKTNVQIK